MQTIICPKIVDENNNDTYYFDSLTRLNLPAIMFQTEHARIKDHLDAIIIKESNRSERYIVGLPLRYLKGHITPLLEECQDSKYDLNISHEDLLRNGFKDDGTVSVVLFLPLLIHGHVKGKKGEPRTGKYKYWRYVTNGFWIEIPRETFDIVIKGLQSSPREIIDLLLARIE